MIKTKLYKSLIHSISEKKKLLAILIDPEDFCVSETKDFLKTIPKETSHLFVGGSTSTKEETEATVLGLKEHCSLPVILFPGDYSQITNKADGLLFLSLLSGRNPEYLIGQQVKAVSKLRKTSLEIIATGYILIDGGNTSAVARVSETNPIPQKNIQTIIDTAKAGEYLGARLIYLEAGSGAKNAVSFDIITAVKKEINIPLLVGGGIKTVEQKQNTFAAGADMVVMGTVFEKIKK